MKVINNGAEGQVEALFELAGELEDGVFDMLEAVIRLHDTLSTLTALQPKDIDWGGRPIRPKTYVSVLHAK